MEIKIKALKFDPEEKMLAFVEKKVAKLERFHENATLAEAVLSNEKDGKAIKLTVHAPGEEMVIERSAKTFEDAINTCVDAMKEKLTRAKEKRQEA